MADAASAAAEARRAELEQCTFPPELLRRPEALSAKANGTAADARKDASALMAPATAPMAPKERKPLPRRHGGCCGGGKSLDVIDADGGGHYPNGVSDDKKRNAGGIDGRAAAEAGAVLSGFEGLSWAPVLLPRAPHTAELLLGIATAGGFGEVLARHSFPPP